MLTSNTQTCKEPTTETFMTNIAILSRPSSFQTHRAVLQCFTTAEISIHATPCLTLNPMSCTPTLSFLSANGVASLGLGEAGENNAAGSVQNLAILSS